MNRRGFLAGALKASAAAIVAIPLPVGLLASGRSSQTADPLSSLAGRIFRGTQDGQIMESRDGGKSWLVHTSFGKHLRILSVYLERDQLYAQVGFQSHTFVLSSSDGRVWYSGDRDMA